MAKNQAQTPTPVATAEATTDTAASNVTPIAGAKRRGSTGPKGPTLRWNDARDIALAESFKAGANTPELLAAALQSHPAFEGEKSPVTAAKVRLRAGQLRKAGAPFPKFNRGGSKRVLDIARLTEILNS